MEINIHITIDILQLFTEDSQRLVKIKFVFKKNYNGKKNPCVYELNSLGS